MLDVNIVCDFIIHRMHNDNLNNLKLQKLLYYVQAWHLSIFKKPMFDKDFQAWVHGPVCRDIFDRFKENKGLYTLFNKEDINTSLEEINNQLPSDAQDHILNVLESYGHLTGHELEALTHKEAPWINARGNCEQYDRCETVIQRRDMQEFYKPISIE